jgi:hypothetical protein
MNILGPFIGRRAAADGTIETRAKRRPSGQAVGLGGLGGVQASAALRPRVRSSIPRDSSRVIGNGLLRAFPIDAAAFVADAFG